VECNASMWNARSAAADTQYNHDVGRCPNRQRCARELSCLCVCVSWLFVDAVTPVSSPHVIVFYYYYYYYCIIFSRTDFKIYQNNKPCSPLTIFYVQLLVHLSRSSNNCAAGLRTWHVNIWLSVASLDFWWLRRARRGYAVYVTLQQTVNYAEKWKMLQSAFSWFRYQLAKTASARCPQLANPTAEDIFHPSVFCRENGHRPRIK